MSCGREAAVLSRSTLLRCSVPCYRLLFAVLSGANEPKEIVVYRYTPFCSSSQHQRPLSVSAAISRCIAAFASRPTSALVMYMAEPSGCWIASLCRRKGEHWAVRSAKSVIASSVTERVYAPAAAPAFSAARPDPRSVPRCLADLLCPVPNS